MTDSDERKPEKKATGYGPVLRNGRFLRLWLAQTGSNLGDAFTRMALLILVTEKTDSPFALSVVIAVQMIPMIAFAPLVGVLVDRWDKKKVMIISDIIRACLLVAVALSTELWQVFTLSFLVSLVSQFFMPARSATVPEVVGREHYLAAVALTQTSYQFMQLIGPALGGALTGVFGTKAAFLVNAVAFGLSALLVASVKFPPMPKKDESITAKAFLHDFREGLVFLKETRALRFLVSTFAVVILGFGFFDVLYIDYTRNVLGVTAAQFGLLESISALGSILGVVLVGQIGGSISKAGCIFGGLASVGLGAMVFMLAPGLVIVGVCGLAFGFFMAFVNVPINTLFAVLVPVDKRGRVNGVVNSLANVSSLVGLGAAGPVAAALGSGLALGLIGVFVLTVAAVARVLPGYGEIDRADRALNETSAVSSVPAQAG